MIERDGFNGPIILRCDGPKCHEYEETHCTHFGSALQKAKMHGWKAVRMPDGSWEHFCRDCEDERNAI